MPTKGPYATCTQPDRRRHGDHRAADRRMRIERPSSVGDPQARRAQEPAARAADGERERAQGQLDAQGAARQGELIGDLVCRHGANVLRTPRHPCDRLQQRHTTRACSSLPCRVARECCGHERKQSRRHARALDRVAAVEAGRPAFAAAARVRDATRRGLRARQASRDGLRDAHRPRHDRRARSRSPICPTPSSPRS